MSEAESKAPAQALDRKQRRIGGGQPLAAFEYDDSMLTIDVVLSVVGASQSTLYRMIAAGEFPEPIKLTKRCSRWNSGLVRQWLRERAGEPGSEGPAEVKRVGRKHPQAGE